jgi:hypothetical protein
MPTRRRQDTSPSRQQRLSIASSTRRERTESCRRLDDATNRREADARVGDASVSRRRKNDNASAPRRRPVSIASPSASRRGRVGLTSATTRLRVGDVSASHGVASRCVGVA